METSERLRSLSTPTTLELTVAGWFLLVAALYELIFNRLASYLGYYIGVGAQGPRAWLATSGEVVVNAVGIMSLFLICATLPRLMNTTDIRGMWWRALLVLLSPIYLLVMAWAVFKPSLSPWLILAAYVATILSAFFITVLAAILELRGGPRRVAIALAFSALLQAFAWITLDFFEVYRFSTLGSVALRSFLVAEVLMVVTPVIAFFVLFIRTPRRLGIFVRHPHLPAIAGALGLTGLGIAVTIKAGDGTGFLSQLAYLVMGFTISVPGGVAVYLVSLFFAALLVGSLILPSQKWQPDGNSRRLGLGLAFIWIAGLQPFRVYLFALMLVGFILFTLSLTEHRGVQRTTFPGKDSKKLLKELDGEEPAAGSQTTRG